MRAIFPAMRDSSFVTASLSDLFLAKDPACCDACGDVLPEGAEADDGFQVRGKGLYLWSRGGQIRFEEPPLCSSCSAAIGLSALARWETEEDEG